MKKFYQLFVACLVALVAPVAANAFSISIDIDNPSLVSVTQDGNPVETKAGENVFEYEYSTSVTVTANEGYALKSIYNITGDYQMSTMQDYYNFNAYEWADGTKYSITTINLAEARSGNASITVDNPEKVRATISGTYKNLDLKPGKNEIKYIPDVETSISIGAINYGDVLYKVTKNGVDVTPNYGSYEVMLEEGVNIEIFADFPDMPATVTFNYLNDCRGVVTAVKVNGTDISDFTDGFSAKVGDKVEVSIDQSLYKFNSIKLNDGNPETYLWGNYSITLLDETNVITIDAKRHATYNVTLNLSDPSQVEVYRGQTYENVLIPDLVKGANTIEFTSASPVISIKPASGCFITSMTANDQTIEKDYSGAYSVETAENMVINVVSGEISRDNTLIVYIDKLAAAEFGYSFIRSDRSALILNDGYNEIKYCEADVPMQFSCYGSPVACLYLDNESIAPQYEGSTSFVINPAQNGQVLKIYLEAEPVSHNVTFTLEGNASVKSATVDRVKSFDPANGLSAMAGSEVVIEPAESVESLEAKLDGNAIDPVDGKYTFTVSADHNFVLKAKESGIGSVGVDAATADNAVYNLNGVKVGTTDNLNNLPAGIYINAGRKIVVK